MRSDAVLVADQAIAGDLGRIEFDLQFHVLRDGDERCACFLDQDAPRLLDRIEIGVVAIPLVRQRLHRRVLQVVVADTQDGQEDAALALLFDEARQFGRDSSPRR